MRKLLNYRLETSPIYIQLSLCFGYKHLHYVSCVLYNIRENSLMKISK